MKVKVDSSLFRNILVFHHFSPLAHHVIWLYKNPNLILAHNCPKVGNYNELLDKNGAFADFLRNYAENKDAEEDATSEFIQITSWEWLLSYQSSFVELVSFQNRIVCSETCFKTAGCAAQRVSKTHDVFRSVFQNRRVCSEACLHEFALGKHGCNDSMRLLWPTSVSY